MDTYLKKRKRNMFLAIVIAFRVCFKLQFMCTYNLMAVWWHWGSWNESYYLQFVVQWWWEYGARLSIRSWGWYFFLVFCFFFSPLSRPFESISDDVLSVTWWFQDIRSSGETKKIGTLKAWKEINEQHIAHQYQYSLRVSQL